MKVPWDTKSQERASAVMLIFQIELPASAWVLKYCEVYAKKAVGLRHLTKPHGVSSQKKTSSRWLHSLRNMGRILAWCSCSSCVYNTTLTGELIICSRGLLSTEESACQWFQLLCSQHCLVLAVCHILMECWVRRIQLPSGLGKNSSHGKTKGYKYHPNLPAAAPAFCGK